MIGLLATLLTTVAFLPQTVRVIKLKETRDLALSTYVLLSLGIFLWFVYGLLNSDLPIIIANGVAFPLVTAVLVMKIKYH